MLVLVAVLLAVLVVAFMVVFVFDEQCPHHLIVLMIEDVTMPDVTRSTGIAKAVVFHIQPRARIEGEQIAAGLGYTG